MKPGAKNDSIPLAWRGFKGEQKPGLDPGPILALLDPDPAAGLSVRAGAEFVKAKHDKGSRVYRAWAETGPGGAEIFIKTFSQREMRDVMTGRMGALSGWKRPWHYPVKLVKLLYEPSLARRSWRAAAACERLGIPAAEPILYLSRRRGWWREEVLVSRGVNPRSAPDARQFFDQNFSRPGGKGTRATKLELIRLLGELLWKARTSGLRFHDFKLHNLVVEEPAGGPLRLRVIDLSEVAYRWPGLAEALFLKRFAESLPASPVFTAGDRIRLLQAYLAAGEDNRSWRELCAKITKRRPAV